MKKVVVNIEGYEDALNDVQHLLARQLLGMARERDWIRLIKKYPFLTNYEIAWSLFLLAEASLDVDVTFSIPQNFANMVVNIAKEWEVRQRERG